MRFLGNIEARTDVKGRVFLPSVFRKEMEASGVDTLVMRKDVFQRCLVLYPEEVWNAMMLSMRQRLSRWDPRQQQVYRQFVSDAEIVTLDSNGRFLLSRRCQEFAGISQQVSFIGMGDSIEIWAREKTEQCTAPTPPALYSQPPQCPSDHTTPTYQPTHQSHAKREPDIPYPRTPHSQCRRTKHIARWRICRRDIRRRRPFAGDTLTA